MCLSLLYLIHLSVSAFLCNLNQLYQIYTNVSLSTLSNPSVSLCLPLYSPNFICLSVCLCLPLYSLCTLLTLSVRLSVCLSVSVFLCTLFTLSVCLSVCLSVSVFLCTLLTLSVCQSLSSSVLS